MIREVLANPYFALSSLKIRPRSVILLLIILPFSLSCTPSVYEYDRSDRPSAGDGYYGTHYPNRNISEEIERILSAVKRIQITGYFYTYQLDPTELFTQDDLRDVDLRELAENVNYTNQSKSGTSIALSNSSSRTTLLTANHIISYPDTIWHFIKSPDVEPGTYLEAVTVLDRQTNLVIGDRTVSEFDIVARDENRDVAIIGTEREGGRSIRSLEGLRINPGNSDRLEWASLVYLLGYPKGTKMVTTGLLSPTGSSQSQNRNFMIDAVFNQGFSGGLVLALRQETGNFEWVGVTISALADFETFLAPAEQYGSDYDPELPYTDAIYIRREPRINYGMTRMLTISEIRDFLDTNRNRIRQAGLSLPNY